MHRFLTLHSQDPSQYPTGMRVEGVHFPNGSPAYCCVFTRPSDEKPVRLRLRPCFSNARPVAAKVVAARPLRVSVPLEYLDTSPFPAYREEAKRAKNEHHRMYFLKEDTCGLTW